MEFTRNVNEMSYQNMRRKTERGLKRSHVFVKTEKVDKLTASPAWSPSVGGSTSFSAFFSVMGFVIIVIAT